MRSIDIPLLSGAMASNRLSIDEAIYRVVAGEGHRVAMLGLSFKPGSDDLRESPYVDLAETLLGKGYEVLIHDPVLNPSSLVGANREYVESKLPHLKRILTNSRILTLIGSEGIGKSRLAFHLASELRGAFPDGPSAAAPPRGRVGAPLDKATSNLVEAGVIVGSGPAHIRRVDVR